MPAVQICMTLGCNICFHPSLCCIILHLVVQHCTNDVALDGPKRQDSQHECARSQAARRGSSMAGNSSDWSDQAADMNPTISRIQSSIFNDIPRYSMIFNVPFLKYQVDINLTLTGARCSICHRWSSGSKPRISLESRNGWLDHLSDRCWTWCGGAHCCLHHVYDTPRDEICSTPSFKHF